MRCDGLLAAVVLASTACGVTFPSTIDSNGVTAAEVRTHPESTLTYPVAYNVTSSQSDEVDRGTFENITPSPATATTTFDTSDRVDRVVAWYDSWLGARGWHDIDRQGDGSRSWVRGKSEDFAVDCSYAGQTGERRCMVAYVLRSARFKAPHPAVPAFGDPVAQATVAERLVGIAATEDRVRYLSGAAIPPDGTPAAAAARAGWLQGFCCASPVMLDDSAMAESPTRSAYHAILLQVAEYNRPDVSGGAFGSIERNEILNLENSGFVLENAGRAALDGAPANAYLYERGLCEAVIFSISYGPALAAAQGIAYRVATVRIVYDVAPLSCDLSRPECFDVLAGTAGAVWSHA